MAKRFAVRQHPISAASRAETDGTVDDVRFGAASAMHRLVGESGCGKTTTAKMPAAVDHNGSGSVFSRIRMFLPD